MAFINSTEDAFVLLHNGYTLLNVTGGSVRLIGCKQYITQNDNNVRRKRSYNFNHPQFWSPLDKDGYIDAVDITNMMRIKAKIKMALCIIYKMITKD